MTIYEEAEQKLIIQLAHDEKAVLKALDKGLISDVFQKEESKSFFDMLKRFYDKYHKVPTPEEMTLFSQTGDKLTEEQRKRTAIYFQELLTEDVPTEDTDVLLDAVISVYKTKAARNIALTLASDKSEDNINQTLEGLVSKYTKLKQMGESGELISDYNENNNERKARYLAVKERQQDTGLYYCFPSLNRVTGGQDNKTLWVVRGGPKAGKSTTLLNMANHVVKTGKNVVYFSAEVNKATIENRLDAMNTGLTINAIKRGQLESREEEKFMSYLDKGNVGRGSFIIIDKGYITTEGIRATIRDIKTQMPIHLVVVDYLGLIHMPYKMESKWVEIGEVAKALRAIAKDEDLPMLTAQQTNKQGDTANAQEIDRTCDMLFDVSRDNPDEETIAGATIQLTAKMIYSRDSALIEFPLEASFAHAIIREVENQMVNRS